VTNFISAGIIVGAVVLSITNTFQALYTTNKYLEDQQLTQEVELHDHEKFTIQLKSGRCLMVKEETK
jgi:hypothetical protein